MSTADTAPHRRAMNDIDRAAEAICREHRGPIWCEIPDAARERYCSMARSAIDALALTEETNTYQEAEVKAAMGGEGAMSYGGQTIRVLGYRTDRRLVSPWQRVAAEELT